MMCQRLSRNPGGGRLFNRSSTVQTSAQFRRRREKQYEASDKTLKQLLFSMSQVTNYTAEVTNFNAFLTLDDSSIANIGSQVANIGA